jgi:hypothetical protein
MATGKLSSYDGILIVEVDYKLHDSSDQGWWGELVPTEYHRLKDGDGYIIEFENGLRGRCFLKKKVNRAVYGLSPLFCYHFRGNGYLNNNPS